MGEADDLEGVPQPGDVVGGKYRVERIMGVGGMGAVVAATHITLNQRVAIKFLLADVAKNANNVARFTREAQAAALIQSDHVAKVTDVCTREDGAPYMVMEYLDGEDLGQRIERGAVAQALAINWVLQACEALAEAHMRGIVHRDLKPANLFLARRPDGAERVKVLDFGISKMTDGKGPTLTRTSALMGSPLYMAPEQMKSAKHVDARSDIWALGCIMFEALSGMPPFIGDTLPEICSRILTEPPSPIRKLVPALPNALEEIVERCLEKLPEQRYQTVAELAFALAPLGGADAQRSVKVIAHVMGATAPAAQPVPAQPYAATHLSLPETPNGASVAGSTVPGAPQPSAGVQSAAVGPSPQQLPQHGYVQQPHHHANGPYPAAHAQHADYVGAPAAPQQGAAAYGSYGDMALQQRPGASTAAPVATSMQPPPPLARTRGWLPAVMAVMLLAGIGAAGAFAMSGHSNVRDDPEPALASERRSSPSVNLVAVTTTMPIAPTTATPDDSAVASASAKAVVVVPPPRPQPAIQPPPPINYPRPPAYPPSYPPPTQPGHVRPGDDLFNTRRP